MDEQNKYFLLSNENDFENGNVEGEDEYNDDSLFENFHSELKKFECPFTWEMDSVFGNFNKDYRPHEEEELIPILKLFSIIMTNFLNLKANLNSKIILTNMEEVDDIIEIIGREKSDHFNISLPALNHIVNASKCFMYLKFKKFNELKETFHKLNELKTDDSDNFKTTIDVCKCICWSVFQSSNTPIELFEKLVKKIPEYDLSYYLLGKNLRRLRRNNVLESYASKSEFLAFSTAFQLSQNNLLFCLYFAQVLKESGMYEDAIEHYKLVLKLASREKDSGVIYLRTALGFLHSRTDNEEERQTNLTLAKECLNKYAKEYSMNNSMFLQYTGIYYMQSSRDYKKAALCFKKAAATDNLGAACLYMKAMLKSNKDFDGLNFLLKFEKNIKNLKNKRLVNFYLHIAFCYMTKENYKQALEYFLKAIKLNPESLNLQNYHKLLRTSNEGINIYEFVNDLLKSTSSLKIHNKELQNIIKSYLDKKF